MSARRAVPVALAAVLVLAARAEATPTCPDSFHLMQWPTSSPVWEFCWTQAPNSSGSNGSGLEIRDVTYNGHLVLARAHTPIINVNYDPGGCGCYRDWALTETRFEADNVVFPGYAEPTSPPKTVCDRGGSAGDVGDFYGVAAEKLSDHLILTTQFESGWYRYTMKWIFWLDGRIDPRFSFAAVSAGCAPYSHKHNVYWRFDFDVDGAGGDRLTESRSGAITRSRSFPRPTMRRTYPGTTWTVDDVVTHRGYRIVPGAETEDVADGYAVGDLWLLGQRDDELDDSSVPGNMCAIRIGAFLHDRPAPRVYNGDLVVWYRGGAFHYASALDDCHTVGPTLEPVGDWSP